MLSFKKRTGSVEISRNCWGWGGRIGFKLQGNCTCCGAKATNNLSNLFQTHGPGLLPSTLLGKFPFILSPHSEHLGNSQKVLKQNDLCDCRFFNFSSEKHQPLCRAKLGEEWGASRRHTGQLLTCCWEGQHRFDDLALKTIQKERLQNHVWAMWVGLQQLWRSQPSLYLCSVHFSKKSALILFPFNQ